MSVAKLIIVNLIPILLISKSIADTNNVTPRIRRQEFGVCDSACQQGINDAVDYTSSINTELTQKYNNLETRINNLENEYYGTVGRIGLLIEQVNNLEQYLSGNVTTLNNRITDDVRGAIDFTTIELEIVRGNINTRINDLTAEVNNIKNNQNNNPGTPGNPGAAMDVYYNLTRRIDTLEYGKISNLTADNNIWRKNFRVVNATFEKMKYNSNCLCK